MLRRWPGPAQVMVMRAALQAQVPKGTLPHKTGPRPSNLVLTSTCTAPMLCPAYRNLSSFKARQNHCYPRWPGPVVVPGIHIRRSLRTRASSFPRPKHWHSTTPPYTRVTCLLLPLRPRRSIPSTMKASQRHPRTKQRPTSQPRKTPWHPQIGKCPGQ
jgi:hypothetical protein